MCYRFGCKILVYCLFILIFFAVNFGLLSLLFFCLSFRYLEYKGGLYHEESLTYETGLREECGVFGMFDLEGGDVARDMYYGLSALQHRGQESCGIAVCDTNGPKGVVNCYKGLGLVNEVFHEETLKRLGGNLGVGHVRYHKIRFLLPSKTHSHWYLKVF